MTQVERWWNIEPWALFESDDFVAIKCARIGGVVPKLHVVGGEAMILKVLLAGVRSLLLASVPLVDVVVLCGLVPIPNEVRNTVGFLLALANLCFCLLVGGIVYEWRREREA